jgi:hypothetical protein
MTGMTRLLRAAIVAVAVFSAGSVARAGAPVGAKPVGTTPTVFVAIDAVTVYGYTLYVSGVVEGEAAPSEWAASFSSSSSTANVEACQRMALLAMAKPGAYKLELSHQISAGSGVCRLVRAQP